MFSPRLTDWKQGDVLTHEHLQEPVDALRELSRVGEAVTPQGQGVQPRDPRTILLVGKVTTTGPAGQSDYTDERYWVRVQGIAPTTGTADQITLQARYDLPANPDDSEEAAVPLTVTATNPAELASHGHLLAEHTPVLLLPVYDAQDTPSLHYLMAPLLMPGVVPVSLTQNGGANGTKTTAPTYTYDLKTFTTTKAGTKTPGATTVGTAQAPMVPRPNGEVTAATLGLAIPATDGGYALLVAYEVPQTEECT